MLKIGDFSKISRISVKTLRYYDEIGLLKPAHIDPNTGYRYYTYEQLPQLNRILALKDLGLTLDQITLLIDENLTTSQVESMLRLKQVEIKKQLNEENERLARVNVRLKQIEQEAMMPDYDVVIKKVNPVLIASVRDIIPTYPSQGDLWNKLETFLTENKISPVGPCFTLYHTDEPEIDRLFKNGLRGSQWSICDHR
jgi:DNA-binding transcriptional MerR regulator